MLSESEDHYAPTLRVLEIERRDATSCGFHLTRSKWDPYPWVNGVDAGSPADAAGVRVGDCLLEVNGEDIVGKRISEVAEVVRQQEAVSLLLWNAGVDVQCSPEALCCGPMPKNLQRLSTCMTSVLVFLECPVCLDTVTPPAYQCDNGHLICMKCRTRTERCPVCRQRLSRGRSLLADQVYGALIQAFDLQEEAKEKQTSKVQQLFKLKNKNRKIPDIKVTHIYTNKIFNKLTGKSSSDDNLTSSPNEFASSSLKAKSLSSNELYSTRTRSKSCKKYLDVESGPVSYHGSVESLEAEEFNCPFDLDCSEKIQRHSTLRHFETAHEGPLVQYFKPKVKLKLAEVLNSNSSCYVINLKEDMFFLKTYKAENDLYLWLWYLGYKEVSDDHRCFMKLCCDKNNILLSVPSSVYSLSSVTWNEIITSKKGVAISTQMLKSFSDFFKSDLYIEIEITT